MANPRPAGGPGPITYHHVRHLSLKQVVLVLRFGLGCSFLVWCFGTLALYFVLVWLVLCCMACCSGVPWFWDLEHVSTRGS